MKEKAIFLALSVDEAHIEKWLYSVGSSGIKYPRQTLQEIMVSRSKNHVFKPFVGIFRFDLTPCCNVVYSSQVKRLVHKTDVRRIEH